MLHSTSVLWAALPGTMARAPESSSAIAAFGQSTRNPASRVAESGPWHLKQQSESIGRMSRRYRSFDSPPAAQFATLSRNASSSGHKNAHPARRIPAAPMQQRIESRTLRGVMIV
jgi:hypothetical protein